MSLLKHVSEISRDDHQYNFKTQLIGYIIKCIRIFLSWLRILQLGENKQHSTENLKKRKTHYLFQWVSNTTDYLPIKPFLLTPQLLALSLRHLHATGNTERPRAAHTVASFPSVLMQLPIGVTVAFPDSNLVFLTSRIMSLATSQMTRVDPSLLSIISFLSSRAILIA